MTAPDLAAVCERHGIRLKARPGDVYATLADDDLYERQPTAEDAVCALLKAPDRKLRLA